MFRIVAIIGFVALTAACAQPAYVHHAGEFNRSAPGFGHDPTDIKSVIVCYSSRGATPAEVLSLARDECGKFGKTALFTKQNYANCPLQTPVSAHFSCEGDNAKGGTQASGQTVGAGASHRINYDGILFSY